MELQLERITLSELIQELKKLGEACDIEAAHICADALLLRYINNPTVSEAYNQIYKWYA